MAVFSMPHKESNDASDWSDSFNTVLGFSVPYNASVWRCHSLSVLATSVAENSVLFS